MTTDLQPRIPAVPPTGAHNHSPSHQNTPSFNVQTSVNYPEVCKGEDQVLCSTDGN